MFIFEKNRFAVATLLLIVATAQTSQAVITVLFAEERDGANTNVRVSFSGTLALPSIVGTPLNITSSFATINNTQISQSAVGALGIPNIGTSSDSGLTNTDFGNINSTSNRTIGFLSGMLVFDGLAITTSPDGMGSQLTVDPDQYFFIFGDRNLQDLNADESNEALTEGAILWTANTTGDTFVFSRSALATVPEPSSALLLSLSLFGLLRRRR